jgi:GNAT superfamily N-acetyltransferase
VPPVAVGVSLSGACYDFARMPPDRDFSIAVEDRGESVVYREGTRSTWVGISFERGIVRLHLGAPLQWYGPGGERAALMSPEEAGRVTARLIEYLAGGDARRVVVDRTPPPTPEHVTADLVARLGPFEQRADGARVFHAGGAPGAEARRRARVTSGVLGVLTAGLGSAAFEAIRARATIFPPIAAAAVGVGLTGLLLWYASRPRSASRLPRGYQIRAARADDLARLPDIERAAVKAFTGYLGESGVSLATLAQVTTVHELEQAMNGGRLWVATHADVPVGFAWVEVVGDYAHLEELDVHPAHGGRGLGRALIETVYAWAISTARHGVTLTTFREVPWNAPFYERLGFSTVDPATLSPEHVGIVRDEASRGFDREKRVTMVRRVGEEAASREARGR